MTGEKTRATASSLPMMSVCPNWESDGETSVYAEFGTLFHSAVEQETLEPLLTEEALELGRHAGKTRSQIENAFDWSMEFLENYRKTCSIKSEHREVEGMCDLLPGRHFYIDHMFFHEDGSMCVLDWKTSRNLDNYQADSNEQGQLYAAALFEMAPHVDKVSVLFVAPFGEESSSFYYTRGDYDGWLRDSLNKIIVDADDPNTEPVACSYCTWCKHYRTCSATTAIIAPAMEDRFGEVLDRANNSPILMSKLRDCVPVLEQVVADIKRSANNMYFERGQSLPGYRPVETRGRTTVRDSAAILRHLAEAFDLSVEDIADYVSIDLKGMDVIIRNNVPVGERDRTVEALRDICAQAGWTSTSSGSLYLKKSKTKELT